MKVRVAIVGAGIIGLSTAVRIQETVGDVHVTVIADRISPNTTSDCAAGFWLPHLLNETPPNNIRRWGGMTLDLMKELHHTSDAAQLGVSMITGFMIYDSSSQEDFPEILKEFLSFQKLTAADVASLFPGYESAYKMTTFMAEPYIYLQHLTKRFEMNGGTYYQCKLNSLSELYDRYDVIVNCSGIEAHNLVNDRSMEPVRGQAMRVKAPWMKHFIIEANGQSYIIPGIDTVVVGGTHQAGNWNRNIDTRDSAIIMDRATKIVPSLKYASIVKEVVGLRPSRPQVRLECEKINHNGKTIPVIHNYGHGGSGVTLFWGCAIDAAQLVTDSLQKDPTSKL